MANLAAQPESHGLDPHPYTSSQHNTILLSPYTSSFNTTSVHRSSAYGKDYITSHFAAHMAQRLYDIKGSRNTTDGRTPRRFPILRFKRSRFTDCISSGRDRTERRNKSLSLVLYLLQNTPYALSISVIFDYLHRTGLSFGRFGIGARNRLPRRSARFGRYKVTFRIHSFLSLN